MCWALLNTFTAGQRFCSAVHYQNIHKVYRLTLQGNDNHLPSPNSFISMSISNCCFVSFHGSIPLLQVIALSINELDSLISLWKKAKHLHFKWTYFTKSYLKGVRDENYHDFFGKWISANLPIVSNSKFCFTIKLNTWKKFQEKITIMVSTAKLCVKIKLKTNKPFKLLKPNTKANSSILMRLEWQRGHKTIRNPLFSSWSFNLK